MLTNIDRVIDPMYKGTLNFDPQMIDYAHEAAIWVKSRLNEYPGSRLICETKVDASPFTCEGQFGTLDAAIVQPFKTTQKRIIVIDYKYGAGIAVSPEYNSQLIYYAFGLIHQLGLTVSEIEFVIYQPRSADATTDEYGVYVPKTWVCKPSDLAGWADKFKNGVKAALDPFAEYVPGDWCRFCPAITICPEFKNRALASAQIAFDEVDGDLELPKPETIAIPNLSKILPALDLIEDWISKVREHAVFVLERGETIDGFKLVQKRSTRKWTDIGVVEAEVKKRWGSFGFSSPELLSPAQLEKAISLIEGKEVIEKFVSDRISNISSGVTLAPESDKRPAVISELNQIDDESSGKEIDMATKKKTKKKTTR